MSDGRVSNLFYFKYICFGEKAVSSNGLAAPVYGLTLVTSISCKVSGSCMQCVSELWLILNLMFMNLYNLSDFIFTACCPYA